ncbi:MAG: helix-turn-helix transcriptional regulator [Ruminococcaceae bacterium]|nr:helix-turn-helix transcriptional regulator [Oscillospiraceae bacterium]
MDYRKRMRDLREDADLTQQQVANALGTSQTMYARYERGANALPIHHLLTLCELYDVSADYLLCRTQESHPYTAKNQKD